MGSHEDQGPHAPMGDYLLAEKMAELAALRATAMGTRTLVAPVIPFGAVRTIPVPWSAASPSPRPTLTQVMREMFANLHRHGLTRLIVINGHGGNVGPIQVATREIHRASGHIIPSLYLWRIAYGLLPGIVGAEKSAAVSGHGADPLTSLGLHLFPELLRRDMIPAPPPLKRNAALDLAYTGLGAASFKGAEIGMPTEYDDAYNKGVAKGDPNLSSAETGAALTEKLATLCAEFAVHFASKT